MAQKNDGGDKTEKPTPKRLRDARRKGDIAKSKDVGPALGMIMWFLLLLFAAGHAGAQITGLMRDTLGTATSMPFDAAAPVLGWAALLVLVSVSLLILGPAALIGVIAEFVQVGALVTTEKLKPSLDKLNPIEGLKRMFSMDNLVELLKTVAKATLILTIAGVILWRSADAFVSLVQAAGWSPVDHHGDQVASAMLALIRSVSIQLFAWTCAIFLLVAAADRAWAQHSFIKKLRMSRRDIKQEHKDNEGDPMLRAQRRQLHEEWANQNAVAAAGRDSLLGLARTGHTPHGSPATVRRTPQTPGLQVAGALRTPRTSGLQVAAAHTPRTPAPDQALELAELAAVCDELTR